MDFFAPVLGGRGNERGTSSNKWDEHLSRFILDVMEPSGGHHFQIEGVEDAERLLNYLRLIIL